MTAEVHPLEPLASAPPHNAEVEAALLGALLTNSNAYDRVADILRPEHFYEPVHGRIYEAIAGLVEAGRDASPRVVAQHFETDEGLAQAGGGKYIYELAACVVSVVNVADYGRQIVEHAKRRGGIEACGDATEALSSAGLDDAADAEIEALQARLDEVTRGATENTMARALVHYDSMIETADAARKADGELTGVATGLAALDAKLGGLHRTDLIVCGGRTAMGKTALAATAILNAARAGQATVMFSLEMSGEQIAMRLAANLTGIAVERIKRGHISDDEMTALAEARQTVAEAALHIDPSSGLTVAQMKSRARRHKRKHGLDLVVIDYLGFVQASGEARRYGNKVQEVSEITRALKGMAKALDVSVLLLSQLSRQVENRDDKRPQLSDLRESGSIEQDADVVLFLYREEYYLDKAEPKLGVKGEAEYQDRRAVWHSRMEESKGVCEIIVAKNRQGPCGTVKVHFDGPTTSMRDIADERQGGMDL